MIYFVTNVFKWGRTGGPQTHARNLELLLNRYATFEYTIVKDGFKEFFKSVAPNSLIYVQSNIDLVRQAIQAKARLIIGPNFIWNKKVDRSILDYDHIIAVLVLRPDPAPYKLSPAWVDHIQYMPNFIDEEFWQPTTCTKTIDVLTVDKSFNYPEYTSNLNSLTKKLKSLKLRHIHLKKYTLKQLKEQLNCAKVLAFPSPRESGASWAHVLLEANMMNVPVVGLSSVFKEDNDEWDACRGSIAHSIDSMIAQIPSLVGTYDAYLSRQWAIDHCGMKQAYQRVCKIIGELKK